MKRIFTLLGIVIGSLSFAQTVFESDLSSWAAGDPTDWMGSKTSIASSNVVEQTALVTYGTSMASLVNETTSHVRFTTQPVTVTPGETYEIKMWVFGAMGDLRTNFYDVTNDAYGTYNPYMDIATESGGSLVMLTQSVTIPATCTEAEFILSLRNTDPSTAAFGVGIVVDSVSIAVGSPATATPVSIYDIQYTTDPSGDSPEAGNLVETSGIVTGVLTVGAAAGTFFIQDGEGAFSGLYVYETGTPVALGDSVTVIGTVEEYYTYTELTGVTSVVVESSGHTLPNATTLDATVVATEEYESVMVQVTGAQCTNADAGFGQFEVTDGSGAILIDDDIFAYLPTLGNYYSITGVCHYSFSEYKILPRTIADITTTAYAGTGLNTANVSIYPNPATDVVYIMGVPVNTVTIYAVDGSIVYNGNNVQNINVNEFTSGVYFIAIEANNEKITKKLIVK